MPRRFAHLCSGSVGRLHYRTIHWGESSPNNPIAGGVRQPFICAGWKVVSYDGPTRVHHSSCFADYFCGENIRRTHSTSPSSAWSITDRTGPQVQIGECLWRHFFLNWDRRSIGVISARLPRSRWTRSGANGWSRGTRWRLASFISRSSFLCLRLWDTNRMRTRALYLPRASSCRSPLPEPFRLATAVRLGRLPSSYWSGLHPPPLVPLTAPEGGRLSVGSYHCQ